MSDQIEFKKAYLANAWPQSDDERDPLADEYERMTLALKKAQGAGLLWHKPSAINQQVIAGAMPSQIKMHDPMVSLQNPSYQERRVDLARSLVTIGEFASLVKGWAGVGTGPVPPRVCAGGKRFLQMLPLRLPVPVVKPTADREVVFIWSNKTAKLQVVLDTEGILAWVSRTSSLVSSDAETWRGTIPKRLIEKIGQHTA